MSSDRVPEAVASKVVTKEREVSMPNDSRLFVSPGARCPGCGSLYAGAVLLLLYSDERGAYCHGCGELLVRDCGGSPRDRVPYRLVLPEGLEGSDLHGKFEGLFEGEGAGVSVDRTDDVRALRLEPATTRGPGCTHNLEEAEWSRKSA